MCRQQDGTASRVGERFVGTRGTSDGHAVIEGAAPWSWDPQVPKINPYVQEHADLIASIRTGRPLNEGRQVAESTLTAIMGREAAYTGQEVAWDELLNCQQALVPTEVQFGPMAVPPASCEASRCRITASRSTTTPSAEATSRRRTRSSTAIRVSLPRRRRITPATT